MHEKICKGTQIRIGIWDLALDKRKNKLSIFLHKVRPVIIFPGFDTKKQNWLFIGSEFTKQTLET